MLSVASCLFCGLREHFSGEGRLALKPFGRPLLPLAAALAIACCGPISQASVVLFDNLSAGSPNGSSGVSNTQSLAQAFSTTAAGFILSDVSLRLWNQNGTSGSFEIQVWDSTGASGSPGAQVGSAVYTGLAENLGSSYGSLLSISGLSVPLTPSTTYYLVAKGTALTDVPGPFAPMSGTLYWDQTNVNTAPEYANSGASWVGPFTRDSYMSVTAVPEPTGALMLATGISVLGLSCSRFRQAARGSIA